jgi:hypothetical protein
MFRRKKEQTTLHTIPVRIPLFWRKEQPRAKKTLDFADIS